MVGIIDATAGGDFDITAYASLVGEEDVTNDTTMTSIQRLGVSFATTDVSCNGAGDGAVDLTTLNPRGLGGSLITDFASNNGATSNYFDVNVTKAGGIEVTGFEVNTSSTASINVSVYYKTGTWVGSESTAGDWTLHETVAVTGAGQDNATLVNFTNSLNLPAGISGIFVSSPSIRYIGATGATAVGNVWASNADFEILEGAGAGSTAPGSGAPNQPRNFSGSILYTAGTLTYAWSNTATTEDLSGLSGGTYTVTVTDGLNCTYTQSATVNEATAISITNTSANVNCKGNATGSIDLTVTGGTGAYSYAWDNGLDTIQDQSGLAVGTYNVTVTDADMCTATTTVTITEPATTLSSSITASTNVLCKGASTGAATAAGTGGTGMYTYLWNDGMAQTNATATGLAAGTYSVVVTDANGCTSTSMVTITEPTTVLTSSTTQTNVLCNGNSTGAATVTASWWYS